jgi:predicted glycogen debranching enzyme
MEWAKESPSDLSRLLSREWLVTNGLGGYAAGTVAGANTRRFHGLLIAALPAPLGRILMLNHVAEELHMPDGRLVPLGGEETSAGVAFHGARALADFRLERGLPVWRYEIEGLILEKSLVLPHLQNTVFLRYRLLEAPGPARLRVWPSLHFRPHEGRVDAPMERGYLVTSSDRRYEITGESRLLPPLRLQVYGKGGAMVLDGGSFRELLYRVEHGRGYDARGTLWCPGYLRLDLEPGGGGTVAASTEPWEIISAMDPEDAFETELLRRRRLCEEAHPAARHDPAGQLVIAADQCVITPNTRVMDAARIRASGDDIRSVIAGYHWFTDWGRDTMISLEGLTLVTGRHREAGYILRMFASHVRDGLIPNLFPEGKTEGLYHTADATLWFFHAIDRYLAYTSDEATVKELLPTLEDIVEMHLAGTRFGIGVDPADGLLKQGEEGYQLTWMDAKVDDWVVTRRHGKAVEINALWYNALKVMEGWQSRFHGQAAGRRFAELAERARDSFNRRFWNEAGGCLFDVVDGETSDKLRLRPNQIFAVSLPNPVLDARFWTPVVMKVHDELLTPYGLRSLGRDDPDYKPRYDGDLRSRDAAYHQGTVWGFLIGPFVDAWLRVHPEDLAGARRFIEPFFGHLREACLGSISEIFDGEPPYTPRGCVAQAWSVAEVLRAWVKTAR